MEGRRVDGARLKGLRERKGWLRPRLAREARVSVSLIKYTENNGHQPSTASAYALAIALGVDIDEFTTVVDDDEVAA
jgi:transcriptional regulator with XRE-family HTH domain